jgi:hypothetical protein
MHFLHAHKQQEREVEASSGPEQHCRAKAAPLWTRTRSRVARGGPVPSWCQGRVRAIGAIGMRARKVTGASGPWGYQRACAADPRRRVGRPVHIDNRADNDRSRKRKRKGDEKKEKNKGVIDILSFLSLIRSFTTLFTRTVLSSSVKLLVELKSTKTCTKQPLLIPIHIYYYTYEYTYIYILIF